jgi:uncharacterized protein with NRDE domain
MCLIVFAWQARAEYPLIVAANRDEWHARPAIPADWWPDAPTSLAGRDLQAGGTWLGVTQNGRFAALTNYRDPSSRKSVAPTRGQLVADYLRSDENPHDYLATLAAHAMQYNDFNLLAGDRHSLWCFSSRDALIEAVAPGVHGLSNHRLDEPWPKVTSGKAMLRASLEMPEDALSARLLTFLSSTERVADADLPNTGVGVERERLLSPPLIVSPTYGTRCSTLLFAGPGQTRFAEHTRDATGRVTGVASHTFTPSPSRA